MQAMNILQDRNLFITQSQSLQKKKSQLSNSMHTMNSLFWLEKNTQNYIYAHVHIGEGHGNSLQHSCLENSIDRGAWQATVHGVAQSDTTEVTQHSTCIYAQKHSRRSCSQCQHGFSLRLFMILTYSLFIRIF